MNFKLSVTLLILCSSWFGYSQTTNPRHPAEWEEISSVIMEYRYFENPNLNWNEALDPFIKTAKACIEEGINFYIIKPSSKSKYPHLAKLDSIFKNENIISPLIHIITKDTILGSFPWTRDHGMNFVYTNDVEQPYIYNFSEDYTGNFIAKQLNYPNAIITPETNTNKYYTDGGNFLTDGHGTFNIAATDVTEDLPTSLQYKYDYFYKYFGIKKTLNVRVPFVHVDYFLKLINEETAIISYIPNNNYDISLDKYYDHQYYIDKAAIAISQNLKSVYGRELKFIPIQNAPTIYDTISNSILHTSKATYTNSLILNKTVLVPQYSTEPFDSLALNTYKKTMPGYKIVGVNCKQYGEFYGAIHCLTHEIYASNPIYIKHKWYQGTVPNNIDGFPIRIIARSSGGIKKAILYWKTNQTVQYQSIPMKNIENDVFETIIPSAESRTTINYYIQVENNNGKVIKTPMVAPKYSYSFSIE
jgi:agmatine/peptidylarginine deiminase